MSEDEELVTSGGARSDDRGGFTGTSSGMRPEESQDCCEAWLSASEETDDTCAKEVHVEADDGDCQDWEAWTSTSEETDETCVKVEVDDGDCQDCEAWLSASEETDDTCAKEVEADGGD